LAGNRAAALVAALALALGTACARKDAFDDVVLISVDTLRADRLGLHGYGRGVTTSLDRWFEGGAVHRRAYATSSSTSPSMASVMTGLYPSAHGVRLLYQRIAPETPIVSDLLPPGYQKAAFVSNAVLTGEAFGIASRFDHYDDELDEREPGRPIYERRAQRTTDAALAWLEERADADRPLFLWVHYIDPHGPYEAPEPWLLRLKHLGERPVERERILAYMRPVGVNDALDYVDRYDEEVGYADEQIDRLLRGLEARRGLGRTLVVFTADHGETMTERELWFRHGWHVYEELIRVPLLLRGPGVAKGESQRPVSGVDVAGTILRHAGVAPPAAWGAADLRRPDALPEDRALFAEASLADGRWLAALRGTRKVVMQAWSDGRLGPALGVDLALSPGEERYQATPAGDALAAELAARAAADERPATSLAGDRGDGKPAPGVATDVTPEARERLRSLGYLE
jgi:arylsulfatase